MRILLIGPPGVGKGTQAARLQEKTGAVQLASGDIFRAELRGETDLGKLAKSYMEKGELVPDEVTIQMMKGRLTDSQVRGRGFLLDGFPRTVPQAVALDRLLDELSLPLEFVISLVIEDEAVVARLGGRQTCPHCGEIFHATSRPPQADGVCDKCGSQLVIRPDDQPDTIRERLRVFHENTAPVLDYYGNKGLLRSIDGTASPDEVFQSILRALT